MRLTLVPLRVCAAVAALLLSAAASAADSPASSDPADLLGNVEVVAGGGRTLPKIGVLPSLASDMEDVTVRSVVKRDLDLCGEFEVLDDAAAPDGLYLADTPIDLKAWAQKGVEAVVKVNGKHVDAAHAELRAQAYFVSQPKGPVFEKVATVDPKEARVASHRLADDLIGALTGQKGGFASHMLFAAGSGRTKRLFAIDADGNDAHPISPADRMTIAGAFGPGEGVHYTASVDHGEFFAFGPGDVPHRAPIKGSVYDLVFSRDRSKVAMSIGVGNTVRLFAGPSIEAVTEASRVGMALDPTFTPSGALAFVGEGKTGQRVYVDNKPISPDGLMASTPTFCKNPDGVRVVFSVSVGRDTDLVSTGETGGGLMRLTQGQGRNFSPACSPDGRLVAFFSTRNAPGPGLYIMRLDGGRPKRVSTLVGDALRWDPLPEPAAAVAR